MRYRFASPITSPDCTFLSSLRFHSMPFHWRFIFALTLPLYIYNVSFFYSLFPFLYFMFYNTFHYQLVTRNFYIYSKKVLYIFVCLPWKVYFCTRFARETKHSDWHSARADTCDSPFVSCFFLAWKALKKKKQKNFQKHLEVILKSLYLCIRFLKRKSLRKPRISVLWKIDKQYK